MAWIEYEAIAEYYGDRRARRSGQRYMSHIDDGIALLEELRATERAMRAFCLHPLVQEDAALLHSWGSLGDCTHDPRVLALAFEYRAVANRYLSTRVIASPSEIALSPLAEVNDMLRADKVQNHFDFVRFHHATHPRRDELAQYFAHWFARLELDAARLTPLEQLLQRRHAHASARA